MHQVDIARGLEVDIVHLLDGHKYLAVMHCNVGDVGVGEGRTAAADVAPRGSAAPIDEHGLHSGLGEVAEQAAAGNAASGNEHTHLLAGDVVVLREDEDLFGAFGVYVAQRDRGRQRCARRGVAGHLYAVGTQHLTGSGYAALAAAGTHTHTGDVLQLIDRYILAVADDCQQLVELHVLAVAHVGVGV